jgi:hypothetical protein
MHYSFKTTRLFTLYCLVAFSFPAVCRSTYERHAKLKLSIFYSDKRQTIILVKERALPLNGLTRT